MTKDEIRIKDLYNIAERHEAELGAIYETLLALGKIFATLEKIKGDKWRKLNDNRP